MTFAREAWPFVLPFVVVAAGLFLARLPVWGGIALVVALAVLLFFRDPHRSFEGPPEVVLAPADGVVTGVDIVEDPAVGPGRYHRVVTFLSAFDVHVQRVPVDGEVLSSDLKRGRKVAAFRDDAGEVNESILTVIQVSNEAQGSDATQVARENVRIGIRQIAGLMARRVVSYLEAGQPVRRGEHLGVIKFGSRVDLLVPESYEVLVEKGDRLRNGETPAARPRP